MPKVQAHVVEIIMREKIWGVTTLYLLPYFMLLLVCCQVLFYLGGRDHTLCGWVENALLL